MVNVTLTYVTDDKFYNPMNQIAGQIELAFNRLKMDTNNKQFVVTVHVREVEARETSSDEE